MLNAAYGVVTRYNSVFSLNQITFSKVKKIHQLPRLVIECLTKKKS